jgi:predicted esterase
MLSDSRDYSASAADILGWPHHQQAGRMTMDQSGFLERTPATTVHGRYLTIPPAAPGPAALLVGFHGYGEDAETQLERLRAIPDSGKWLLISIQALHRFYERRTERVVASWMTWQHREFAIADNLAYVAKCLDAVAAESPVLPEAVFAGFSQGVAMAFRAAANAQGSEVRVISVGGDIPPELDPVALGRIQSVLLIRGSDDAWYTKEQFAKDEAHLTECGVMAHAVEIEGGHEWSAAVTAAAARFLAR